MFRSALWTVLCGLSLFAGGSSAARADFIGAGTSIPNDEIDSQDGNGRTNIDLSNPVFLTAGDYRAITFNFDAGSASAVMVSALILRTISGGVLVGANNACHAVTL